MTDRLNKIFSALPSCNVFADIGCDHGYMAKAMVDSGRCKKAIISDVSAKCLKKAEDLLKDQIIKGVVLSAVSDGFDNLPDCDLALIAGMGGEEIISILNKAKKLPEKLALQPMKNAPKVRQYVIEKGYKVLSDRLFKSANKFYDLIILERGKEEYTEEQLLFGRDNLKGDNPDFIDMLKQKINLYNECLAGENLSEKTRLEIQNTKANLEKYV